MIKTITEITSILGQHKSTGLEIGLVPTMGALHQGHLDLVHRATEENDIVVVSIFVNPTQFNDKSDLEKYPRDLDADLSMLYSVSPELLVFVPEEAEIYNEGVRSADYDFNGLDRVMEGTYRPGHFQGVATIVEKLLQIIQPDRAYFGEKDFQQLLIIRSLVEQRALPVKIVGCSIVREANGLAMSSRNSRLSKRLREEASFLFRSLETAKTEFGTKSAEKIREELIKEFEDHPDLDLEYFIIADEQKLEPIKEIEVGVKYRGFIAVYAGEIRLIDNLALN